MTFADIPAGASVFLDANTLVYHFINHPTHGPACTSLLQQIEQQALLGFVSSQVLGEVAHRLMTIEAASLFGWPASGIVYRLKRQPQAVRQLTRFRQALQEVQAMSVQVLPVSNPQVLLAGDVSLQFGLLSNDALVVAVMQTNQLTHLASNDADFDVVSGISRYAPL